MKKITILFCTSMLLLLASCKSATSYSENLKNEKETIDKYIKRNHIHIIYEEPEYDAWGENDYLELDDYCYFHLSKMGDTTTAAIETKDNINLRYRRYTLTANPDTFSYWNTNELNHPIEFQYNVQSTSACTGWHYAIGVMKYTGSEGKLICPSRLGFDNDNSDVIPYGYDLALQIRRF